MDYSKFNDEDFDVKTWINSAFNVQKEGSLEQYATTLVMKLQMFMQEVSNVLEENCQQVVSNLPRVGKELDALGQEASLLHEQMKMVKYDIQKVEHETANSMEILLKLDTIKCRIKLASDALREADNWTTLSSDVEEVFDTKDIDAIARKIVGMQQSLHILSDVPDYADRCQYLEMLKNRLEATSSPSVVSAFSSQSLESAQKFTKIFSDIERLPQLYKYYHKCHKSKLQEFWKDLQSDHPITEQLMKKILDSFYDHLLTVWQAQVKWCEQVFPDPVSIVCDLLSDCLRNLDPAPSFVLSQCIKSSDSLSSVQMLIVFKSLTDNFVDFLEKTMSHQQLSSCNLSSLRMLLVSIYSPFKSSINKFSSYERTTLNSLLDRIKLDHEDFMESTSLIEQSVSTVFGHVNESMKRCVQMTNGVSFISYLEVLKDYLRNYLRELKRVVRNIFEKCSANPVLLDTDEWSHFQNSLRVVQMSGDLILHFDELDQLLISNVLSLLAKHRQPYKVEDDNINCVELKRLVFSDSISYFLENSEEQSELENFIKSLEEGDILDEVKKEACDLCILVHKFSFDIVFNPLKHHFLVIPNLQAWKSENVGSALTWNLPNFSLAPQEYITNVGQYLMTLPQQLEPFTAESSLMMQVALRHGKLPFTADLAELPEHLADLWLESLARGSMHTYCEQILLIPELTPVSSKQLIIDIGYITNVLDDLGLKPIESIKNISALLEADEESYQEVAENCPQRLSSAIGGMRGFLKK